MNDPRRQQCGADDQRKQVDDYRTHSRSPMKSEPHLLNVLQGLFQKPGSPGNESLLRNPLDYVHHNRADIATSPPYGAFPSDASICDGTARRLTEMGRFSVCAN